MCEKKCGHSHKKQNLVKSFIKKIYERNIIAYIIIVIFVLLVVQICFTVKAPYKWMESVWEPGDLIALVGTLTLGYISMRQTAKANDMSKKLMDIEIQRYKMEIRPFVMVTNWEVFPINHSDIVAASPKELYIKIGSCDLNNEKETAIGLVLTFQNTTAAPLLLSFKSAKDQNNSFSKGIANKNNEKLFLRPDQEKKITFCMTQNEIKSLSHTIRWEFILENRFADRYQESFDTLVLNIEPKSLGDEWYCNLSVQNVSIGKFVKDTTTGNTKLQPED